MMNYKSQIMLICLLCAFLTNSIAQTNAVNRKVLWGLKSDLRQLVVEDSFRKQLEKNEKILVDLSLLNMPATVAGKDMGYNKAHQYSAGCKLSDLLITIQNDYSFEMRDAAYISIFTRKNVYMVRYMHLDTDERNLTEFVLSTGDVVLVSLRGDFY